MSATHEQQASPAHRIEIQPPPIPKATKGSLVAALAMLACVAACALPVLLAGGVGAGMAALFSGWNLAAVVILVATAAGVLIWRRHIDAR